jgi:deoxyribodipyrimidine photo-lyase
MNATPTDQTHARATPADPGAPVIVWFRRDLRLADNPALQRALSLGRPVIPVFVLDETPGIRPAGAASNWWLGRSLSALGHALAARGSRLILRRGPASEVLTRLVAETGADHVLWNRLYDPGVIDRDAALKRSLRAKGITVASFNASLLTEPWTVLNKSGEPFKVFTPYWRAARPLLQLEQVGSAPDHLAAPPDWPVSEPLDSWALQPASPDWTTGFNIWTPGEDGAARQLDAFIETGLAHYADGRDRPAAGAVSRLSPHMHFGEIGPRQVWAAINLAEIRRPSVAAAADKFRAELGWREFSHALLYQRPDLETANFKPAFDRFPWRDDPAGLRAWQRGATGYPMVDAGMRELWTTGVMHNRVRMLVASFLVKHLLIDWRHGEAWFWDTLLDADRAANSASWQWVAGCGADAAPYFRIFSPMGQGEKFDPDGSYVRKWVPELARIRGPAIHSPWTLSPMELRAAGVTLGHTYPAPIVDHGRARERALAALATIRNEAE